MGVEGRGECGEEAIHSSTQMGSDRTKLRDKPQQTYFFF